MGVAFHHAFLGQVPVGSVAGIGHAQTPGQREAINIADAKFFRNV
jgi:hypothetical protein